MDGDRKRENPEGTYTQARRTCKLHTKGQCAAGPTVSPHRNFLRDPTWRQHFIVEEKLLRRRRRRRSFVRLTGFVCGKQMTRMDVVSIRRADMLAPIGLIGRHIYRKTTINFEMSMPLKQKNDEKETVFTTLVYKCK